MMKEQRKANHRRAQTIIGKLSGKKITIPDVNVPPMPALANPGVIHNGKRAENFGEIDSSRGYPDVRSFRRKFGLIIPATKEYVGKASLGFSGVAGIRLT